MHAIQILIHLENTTSWIQFNSRFSSALFKAIFLHSYQAYFLNTHTKTHRGS